MKPSMVERQIGKVIGKHVYANMEQIDEKYLSNMDMLIKIINSSSKIGNFHIIEISAKKFIGTHSHEGGVSVIAIIEESHIALHTWPESNYATIDIYTCGEASNPEAALDYVIQKLKPQNYKIFRADRGN
ncbi:MAG: adenosylmethionine decarboxylase [Candidatus Micrarchaeia archaeon]